MTDKRMEYDYALGVVRGMFPDYGVNISMSREAFIVICQTLFAEVFEDGSKSGYWKCMQKQKEEKMIFKVPKGKYRITTIIMNKDGDKLETEREATAEEAAELDKQLLEKPEQSENKFHEALGVAVSGLELISKRGARTIGIGDVAKSALYEIEKLTKGE